MDQDAFELVSVVVVPVLEEKPKAGQLAPAVHLLTVAAEAVVDSCPNFRAASQRSSVMDPMALH